MTVPTVTTAGLRTVESVLDMGGGYVLDFSNRTFTDFFREHGVNIDELRYEQMGTSKANRLRCFLRSTPPPRSGQILAALLAYRQCGRSADLQEDTLTRYLAVVQRLGGTAPPSVRARPHEPITEAALLAHLFRPEVFARLPGNPPRGPRRPDA